MADVMKLMGQLAHLQEQLTNYLSCRCTGTQELLVSDIQRLEMQRIINTLQQELPLREQYEAM